MNPTRNSDYQNKMAISQISRVDGFCTECGKEMQLSSPLRLSLIELICFWLEERQKHEP